MANNKLSLLEKLTSKCVVENHCLVFKSYTSRKGYGLIKTDNKLKLAHRVMYEIHHGEIPANMVVMHKCDNPPCINIEHLILGTQAENIKDMHSKGRAVFNSGENNQNCKLSIEQIQQIKTRYKPYCRKNSTYALALEFGVNRKTIELIINGKHWSSNNES